MTDAQRARWDRICAFAFTADDVLVTFEDKLITKTGWTRRAAERVIVEYRRFLFVGDGAERFSRTSAAVLFSLTLLIGLSKIVVGLSRGKPVFVLVFLCIATLVVGGMFVLVRDAPISTTVGKRLHTRLLSRRPRTRLAALPVFGESSSSMTIDSGSSSGNGGSGCGGGGD